MELKGLGSSMGRAGSPRRANNPPPPRTEPVRYISTRGEAPPLGFVDVTLAGLARDGGLYVPEGWPRFHPQAISTFPGRSYAEVAVDVMRPFLGGAIPEQDLARLAREAYGTFRHPATIPLVQL